METKHVVAAVIIRDNAILATQRGYGDWTGWWEFPGGKVEEGETPEAALVREIREELKADIAVGEELCTVEYDYPQFHLSMQCFACTLKDAEFELTEHLAARWLSAAQLDEVEWLPGDVRIIETLKEWL